MTTGYAARVIADSVHHLANTPCRLTTLELTFPRFVLAEFNTHRVFSRNSASSRAIPVTKQLRRILEHPFVPTRFGRDMRGMQANKYLTGAEAEEAREIWLEARNSAVVHASTLLLGRKKIERLGLEDSHNLMNYREYKEALLSELSTYSKNRDKAEELGYLGVHKQTANRLLEPFTWHTVIVTATEWSNFIALRDNGAAQPEIQIPARMAVDVMANSGEPRVLEEGGWHLPLIQDDEWALINEDSLDDWKRISAGRCARVSYETHDGVRDTNEDIRLANWLISDGHMSPLEHVATPIAPHTTDSGATVPTWSGNFRGWHQFRKDIPFESDYAQALEFQVPAI